MRSHIYLTILLILALSGLVDSAYLTYEHFSNFIPPCSAYIFVDCGKVLKSSYAEIYGIPVAIFGIIYYTSIALLGLLLFRSRLLLIQYALVVIICVGSLASVYFIFLQLVVIKAICLYCMASAITTFLLLGSTFTYARAYH